jgi:hypothetical protein
MAMGFLGRTREARLFRFFFWRNNSESSEVKGSGQVRLTILSGSK